MGVGVGKCAWHEEDGWTDIYTSIYRLVMVVEDEGSLLRLLVFETPVTREEMVFFGPVKML